MPQRFDASSLNPSLPGVTISIGGKQDRPLSFSYGAMALAEKLTGQNLLQGTFEASFSSLDGLLFAGLLESDPDLKIDEVRSWIHFANAPIVYQALMSAWLGSIPVPSGEKKLRRRKPSAA